MPELPSVTRQTFEEERIEAKRKLDTGEHLSENDVFAICAGCDNTALNVYRLSAELALADFSRCEHCRVYQRNKDYFRTEPE